MGYLGDLSDIRDYTCSVSIDMQSLSTQIIDIVIVVSNLLHELIFVLI